MCKYKKKRTKKWQYSLTVAGVPKNIFGKIKENIIIWVIKKMLWKKQETFKIFSNYKNKENRKNKIRTIGIYIHLLIPYQEDYQSSEICTCFLITTFCSVVRSEDDPINRLMMIFHDANFIYWVAFETKNSKLEVILLVVTLSAQKEGQHKSENERITVL